MGEASFLTDDEKRAATGYAPLPVSFAPLAKYDPNQPRVPAGNSDGGQWTSGGEGEGGSDYNDEGGDEGLLPENAMPVQGHHYEPKGVLNKFPLSPEARGIFMKDVRGSLRAQRHGWSEPHKAYNEAVEQHFKNFSTRIESSQRK